MTGDNEPDFEISEASISGTHRREDIFKVPIRSRRPVARIVAQVSVLVVIVFVAGFFVIRAPLQAFIIAQRGPTPTPTRPPRPLAQLIIQTNVMYGTLTVNGKVTPFNPDDPQHTIVLTKQHSVVTLNAPPFHTITCTIDSTTLGQLPDGRRCGSSDNQHGIYSLYMYLAVDDLPDSARQQFNTYVTQKLAHLNALQVIVPAKEHYATGVNTRLIPTVALSATPLRAQVRVTLNDSISFSPECKDAICPSQGFFSADVAAPPSVGFSLQVDDGWRFFDGANRQIATYLPGPDPAHPDLNPYTSIVSVQVQYNAATGWSDIGDTGSLPGQMESPTSQIANEFCNEGASLLSEIAQPQGTSATGGESSSGQPALTGCLFSISTDNNQQTPSAGNVDPITDTSSAWFLIRFGAVLAVNAKARALLPQLPQATRQEVREVQQAMQQAGG